MFRKMTFVAVTVAALLTGGSTDKAANAQTKGKTTTRPKMHAQPAQVAAKPAPGTAQKKSTLRPGLMRIYPEVSPNPQSGVLGGFGLGGPGGGFGLGTNLGSPGFGNLYGTPIVAKADPTHPDALIGLWSCDIGGGLFAVLRFKKDGTYDFTGIMPGNSEPTTESGKWSYDEKSFLLVLKPGATFPIAWNGITGEARLMDYMGWEWVKQR
jgi:hypothetical protein